MEQRGIRLDAGGQQGVHQALVEGDALFVRLPGAVGEDARPGDGETVGLHAQRFHELHILRVAMVLVHRDIACVAHGDVPGLVREGVPDGRLASVFLNGAFHLVGSGGASPEETIREPVVIFPVGFSLRGGGGARGAGSGTYAQGGSPG